MAPKKTARTTRRQFLTIMSAALSAPTLLSAANRTDGFPLAFSTLGCPRWDWSTILARAAQWGYAAIELRGLQGEMDLSKRVEFQGTRLTGSLKDLQALNLRISDLGASARMHESDPKARAAQLGEAKRFIDLAQRLGVPYIRVFGDRVVPGEPKQASIERVTSGLRELGQHAKDSGVTVLIESHGDFCDSPTLLEILRGVDMPNVALLWDAHHTVVAGKEEPAITLRQLGSYIRHVHLKDSKPEGKDVRYVLTGTGTVPLREIARLLVKQHYSGYFCFEWEKAWHPEIEEPEIAFPQFAKVFSDYLTDAGLNRKAAE
jgi:sugar phosphate isomerase/epimerase